MIGSRGDEMEHWEKVTMARRMYWIRLQSLQVNAKKFDITEKEARKWINGRELPLMPLTNIAPMDHLTKVSKYRKMPFYTVVLTEWNGNPFHLIRHSY